jgi:hypothetical protein
MDTSRALRLFFVLIGVLLSVAALPGRAAGVANQVTVGFTVSTLIADPSRNYVYVVDAEDALVLQFDMTTGLVVNTAPIADSYTQGNMAISSDDSKLYVQETDTYQIAVYSLPNLTPLTTLTPGLYSYNIACGENGRLFENAEAEGASIYYIWVELDPTTGAYIGVYGFSENYTSWVLMRTSADGSNLYVASPGVTGPSDIYQYSLAGGTVSSAKAFAYNSQDMVDFKPDDANGRIYIMDTSIQGVNVLIESDDNDGTVWPLLTAEGGSVDFSPSGNVIYGASASVEGDIRAFNRPGGTPTADYVVGAGGLAVPIGQIAVTPNGNCFYVAYDEFDAPSYTDIGIISPNGLTPTLQPTVPSVVTFPTIATPLIGATYTLAAFDSLGLPIIYTVLSGPADIVNGDQLHIEGAGTIVVEASVLGNALDLPESQTITLVANIQMQTITPFAAIGTQAVGVPFSITIPTASSGLPVKLTAISGSATIAGHVITPLTAGTLVLAANQAGNAAYAPATQVTATINVNKGSQTITPFNPIATQYILSSPTVTITLPTSSSGLPVTIGVQSGPATISGNVLTLTGTGTVTLTANQAGNANYNAATEVTTSFLVYAQRQSIGTFGPIANRVYTPVPFTVPVPTATSGFTVTLSVLSGPATISGNTVTLTGAGTVVLAANQAGNQNISPAPQVTTSFVVSKASQTITAFAAIPNVTYGVAPFTVTPPTASSGLPVSLYLVSGPASLSGDTVTILAAGTVTLEALQPGSSAYNAAPAEKTSFTVSKESQTIAPFTTIGTQTAGTVLTITPPAASSGLPVTLTVKGPAKISGDTVTLTGIGTVTLTASQPGSSGVTAATSVTTSFLVIPGTQTIAAFATIPTQTFGEKPFNITAPTASSGLPVTLSIISGPATISGTRITLTGGGTVVVAANQAGNTSFTAAPQVTTSFTVNQASQTIAPFHLIGSKSITSPPFRIIVPIASSGLPVTVSVLSGPATISGNIVTVTGAGVVELAADQAGNANYNAAPEVTITFSVQ